MAPPDLRWPWTNRLGTVTPRSRWRDPAVLAALGLFGLLALLGAADWAEFKQEVRHAMGTGQAPPKPGK